MSHDTSSEIRELKSFEARVLARFEGVERRIEVIDKRLERLDTDQEEMYQRWEQVLRELTDGRKAMWAGINLASKE
jgi:chromosome segregation ATPase